MANLWLRQARFGPPARLPKKRIILSPAASTQHSSDSAARVPPTCVQRRFAGCACRGRKAFQTAYIALGSNLGDRVAEIEKACNEMDRRGIRVKRTSSLWETEPMYIRDQGRFLNGACEVSPATAWPVTQ